VGQRAAMDLEAGGLDLLGDAEVLVSDIEFRPTLQAQRDDAAIKGQTGRQKIYDGLLRKARLRPRRLGLRRRRSCGVGARRRRAHRDAEAARRAPAPDARQRLDMTPPFRGINASTKAGVVHSGRLLELRRAG
jgi:hypothetical protein